MNRNNSSIIRVILMATLWLLSNNLCAQHFEETWRLPLPVEYKAAEPQWADLDNDGLLDIVLLLTDQQNKQFISIYRGDTLVMPHEVYQAEIAAAKIFIADFNRDNNLDLIISGDQTSSTANVFLNQGNFSFVMEAYTLPAFSDMLLQDVTNDALPEWIVNCSATEQILIYRKAGDNWIPIDTLAIRAQSMTTLDADGNGYRDLFISGQVNADSLFSGVLLNHNALQVDRASQQELTGIVSTGDLNHDGIVDLILNGKDITGNDVVKRYLSNQGGYAIEDVSESMFRPNVWMTDLNSDGVADLSYWHKTAAGDSIRLIKTSPDEFDTLSVSRVTADAFGDVEHDGDLDIIQIQRNGSLQLVLFENQAPVNHAPQRPVRADAFAIFDRVFIKWQGAQDDHTAASALTYDVYLDELQSCNFDLLNGKRLNVSHGNNGAADFVLLKNAAAVGVQFAIQAVDNSLHAGSDGVCVGGVGGGGGSCQTFKADTLKVCSNEKRLLTAPSTATWYSFSGGFLKTATSLEYTSEVSDVVFYYLLTDCAHVQAWYIEVKDTVRHEQVIQYACENSVLNLSVEDYWLTTQWENSNHEVLGTGSALAYPVAHDDRVHARMTLGTGCLVDREFDIRISKPDVTITTENTHVYYGKSVQLEAAGAEAYVWDSANGIFETTIPNPTVSPTESTTYRVTGYDSIGCADDAQMLITVERNGYVPSLFTPNNDGKNDILKIYGVTQAENFTFEIFNRNGSMVFSASSVGELISGWDGTARGIRQPNGTYFWKVKGSLLSGEPMQLNGKNSGSIVLLR